MHECNIYNIIFLVLQVFQRLQKFNICMSHQVTSILISAIGADFDAEVHKWKHDGQSELEQTSELEVK